MMRQVIAMTSEFGRTYRAIPGPSVIPERVLRAMHRASPDIYAKALEDDVENLLTDLKSVARTSGNAAIYISNGHGAWEAALTNLFSPGDRILVLATGTFALGWGGFAEALGVKTKYIDFGLRSDICPARVADELAADTENTFKAVIAAHVDTASSVRNDIAAVAAAISAAEHPALLLVDCIASLACDPFEMDGWGVDVMIAGSQKGLMLPPGLSFVFFSDRALETGRSAGLRTPYWDWQRRVDPGEFYHLFCGTAPTQHIFGLRESLNMLLREEGLEAALERHRILAQAIWAAIDIWRRDGPLEFNITDPLKRSHAVTALRAGPPHGALLRGWASRHAGVSLGIGLGMSSPDDPTAAGSFRIGHMGHLNAHMVLGALASIEAGFESIGFPRGRGAVEAAAAVCAGEWRAQAETQPSQSPL